MFESPQAHHLSARRLQRHDGPVTHLAKRHDCRSCERGSTPLQGANYCEDGIGLSRCTSSQVGRLTPHKRLMTGFDSPGVHHNPAAADFVRYLLILNVA